MLQSELKHTYCWAVLPDRVYERAAGVQEMLTDRGTHRSAGPIDLMVAATAEGLGMTLLHYDADFEQVAEVTGQPTLWLAEPGTID
jgi:predicted nucleic acid-binding protein